MTAAPSATLVTALADRYRIGRSYAVARNRARYEVGLIPTRRRK